MSADLKLDFERDGFLILPKFFSAEFINEAQQEIERVKQTRPFDVVVDDLDSGERTVLGLMSAEAVKRERMKLNDLYLQQQRQRDMALSCDLVLLLKQLFSNTPTLCNSLYLEHGSAQAAHVDALYMTPRTPGHLIATWVALEDSHEDAGELEYFPGSHRIEPMIFSDGGHGLIASEMANWRAYMDAQIRQRGIEKQRFAAKKGDVLIWHANLLHGGGNIANLKLTRKSCVFHYFSETDSRSGGCTLISKGGGFWIDRPPQPLPLKIALQLPFSEKNYIARYPDVADAVGKGAFANGRTHYEMFGKHENRLPC